MTEKNIVSFGCMCSTAMFLKKNGYREKSCFFDWVDSNLMDNIALINEGFSDILNPKFLKQNFSDCPHIVTNTKYSLSFAHLFDPKKTFASQEKYVKRKVAKSITNFMDLLNSKCAVLIYYLRDKNEIKRLQANETYIMSFLEQHYAELIIISNYKCSFSFAKVFQIKTNNIHKPFGGAVSFPFEDTEFIEEYLNGFVSEKRRQKNCLFYEKKKRRTPIMLVHAFLNKYRKNKLIMN